MPPYFGPTISIAQLAEDVNANTGKIPTLWAKGVYSASIVDHGKHTDVHGDAALLYAKPKKLLFVGWADPLGQVFRMGCGPNQYWLSVLADTDTTWFGSFENIDRVDMRQLPVRPDLIEAVLGLDSFNEDLLSTPSPVMRFNNDQHAYMVVWNVMFPDRWVAQKEIWYDLDSKLPRLVNLFDANGRVILSAYLSDNKPIPDDDATTKPANPAMIATSYRLFFPESGSRLELHLDEIHFRKMGHPNAQNFAFNSQTAGTSHVIDLDATAH